MSPTAPPSVPHLEGFWTRELAHYLQEHRHPLNRATHVLADNGVRS